MDPLKRAQEIMAENEGFEILAVFPGEYVLLYNEDTFEKIRVYSDFDTGRVK